MEVSDAAVLAGISAAFIVLKNVRKKAKNTGDRWVKDYIKRRNSRLINLCLWYRAVTSIVPDTIPKLYTNYARHTTCIFSVTLYSSNKV
jgi:hypothetical protein